MSITVIEATEDFLFHVTEEQSGERLDKLLASLMAMQSRSVIQGLIENGDVLVNEKPANPVYRVHVSDNIACRRPPSLPVELNAEPMSLDVVHEDDDLIVINTRAGLMSIGRRRYW